MSGLREILSAGHKPDILLRSVPDVCQTEIRTGAQAAGASGKRVTSTQLGRKKAAFSRALEPGSWGGLGRIRLSLQNRGKIRTKGVMMRLIFVL